MGMWAPGEIALLCEIAQPEIGVVTMVGPVHQERLGTIEAIAWEKSQLPASLPGYGVAVLNADDPRVTAMAERSAAHPITFGLNEKADVRAEDIQSHGLAGVNFMLVKLDFKEDRLGGQVSAPVFAELAPAILTYLGVRPDDPALVDAPRTPLP